jgi:Flp pilus assembly protein TadG
MTRRRRSDRGQAVVELALTIPLVVVLLLAIVQVGLVVRDQILVVHASREAARAAAVDPDPEAARRAAIGSSALDPHRLHIDVTNRGAPGSTLSVAVRYSSPTEVPLIGALLPDVGLRAVTSLRVEV